MPFIILILLIFANNNYLKAEESASLKFKKSNEPTYISSANLAVDNIKRIFIYSGNVTIKQAELTMSSATLEGSYDKENQIDVMTAKGDVFITSKDITASSQLAVYDAKTSIITLTKNPEVTQHGSTITADLIRIYVDEDRSEADGEVKVRMAQEPGQEQQK